MTQKITLLTVVFLLLTGIYGNAQGTTATISGTVSDSTGAVVPGTKIVILNEDTGISRDVAADETGRYSAPSLGLGNYRVTMVDSSTINDLPLNGRDLAQLITLQTGVVQYDAGDTDLGSGKLIVVSGSRPTTNVFMIDGVALESYTQKTPTGTSGQFLGAEAVREFRVESNAYSAEFGRGGGGIFNVATKSGTNMLNESLFEYLRNDNFDANRWEANRSGLDKPEFKRNQFGFSLGGPLKRVEFARARIFRPSAFAFLSMTAIEFERHKAALILNHYCTLSHAGIRTRL